jgi:hypothetical protein
MDDFILTLLRALAPDSSSAISRYMMDSIRISMDEKVKKLKFEDQFVAELRHLNLGRNNKVYWGDDDDDEISTVVLRKGSTKNDLMVADFGERTDEDLTLLELGDQDEFDRLTEMMDLKGLTSAEVLELTKKLQAKK